MDEVQDHAPSSLRAGADPPAVVLPRVPVGEVLPDLGQDAHHAADLAVGQQAPDRPQAGIEPLLPNKPRGVPRVNDRRVMTAVNDYLRRKSGLEPRLVELAILVTAREMDAEYVWTSHEPAAQKAGLEQSIIDTVKFRLPATALGEKERVIVQLGRGAIGKHKVDSETFAQASAPGWNVRRVSDWMSIKIRCSCRPGACSPVS